MKNGLSPRASLQGVEISSLLVVALTGGLDGPMKGLAGYYHIEDDLLKIPIITNRVLVNICKEFDLYRPH